MCNLEKKECGDSFSALINLIDLIPDLVIILNSSGIIIAANKMALKYSGYASKELVGNHFLDFFSEKQALALAENAKKRWSGEDVPPYEIKFILKDGNVKFFEVKGNLFHHQCELLNLVVIIDVTQQNRHQELLQKTLAESEQKFRDLAEHSPNMIFINQNRKVVYVNEECTRMLGYAREYFYSPDFNFREIFAPEFRDLALENLQSRINSLEIKPYLVQLISKDGRRINVEINTKLIEYNGQQALLGVVTDVTELKKAQENIIQSEECLKLALEAVNEGIWDYDIPSMKAFFSPNFFTILGFEPQELPEDKISWSNFWKTLIHPSDIALAIKVITESIVQNKRYSIELRMRTNSGKYCWILASGKNVGWDARGKPIRVVGTIRDITETKKIQDDLLKSEMRFSKLVEIAQEGIWAIDKNYKTTFVNPRMAQMLGYEVNEIMEKSVFKLFDKKDAELVKKFLKETEITGNFEFEFPRKDGSHIYTSISSSEIRNDMGEFIGSLSLIADITQQKDLMIMLEKYSRDLEELVAQRTKQLEETQAQLVTSERLAAIGELAGMVGHDLRNPLTGIKNAVYYLDKNGATIPGKERQAEEMLQIINKCVHYSNKIIVDLLDYSKDLHLDKQDCLLWQVMNESLTMIDVSKKIKIFNHIPEDLQINIDCDKFKRVFSNLAKNAIDSMPNGGKLTVCSQKNPKNLKIFFIDTGTGISKEILPKLFSPLLTTKAQGMGFGLAICKRVVDAHGGKIEATSDEGIGTTFTITLPIEPKLELIENNLSVDSVNFSVKNR